MVLQTGAVTGSQVCALCTSRAEPVPEAGRAAAETSTSQPWAPGSSKHRRSSTCTPCAPRGDLARDQGGPWEAVVLV